LTPRHRSGDRRAALNRRKIDLIAEPEWEDPPKARIAELLTAVDDQLRRAGLAGLRASWRSPSRPPRPRAWRMRA